MKEKSDLLPFSLHLVQTRSSKESITRAEENVRLLCLLFLILGTLLLCSVPIYLAFPDAWLPFGLILFPFGSGLLPLGIMNPLVVLPFLIFYGAVELTISWGLYRKADSARITLILVCFVFIFNAIVSWYLHFQFLALMLSNVHAAVGAFLIWYMTRWDVEDSFASSPPFGGEYLGTVFHEWSPRLMAIGAAVLVTGILMGRFILAPDPGQMPDMRVSIIMYLGFGILVIGIFTWVWGRIVG